MGEVFKILLPQTEQPAVPAQIIVCRKPRRLCLGGDVLIGVRKQARGAVRGADDLGFRSRVEFFEHRFLVGRILLADASNSWLIVPVFATPQIGWTYEGPTA